MSLSIPLPAFNHPEVSVFYEHDLSIPKEKVAAILQLPRATLIEDMEMMLKDTIERNDFFQSYEDEDIWWEMPKHALWVLVELEAEEALPTILEVLRQGEDFERFWMGDFSTENFWVVLYHLGGNALDELTKFFLEPRAWYNRTVVTSALTQIALHQPERRTEILQWFQAMMETFLAMDMNDPSLDGDVVSAIVSDLIILRAEELLPQIKMLYDQELVYLDYAGDYASVEKDIKRPSSDRKRKVDASIFERYEDAMTWHYYRMRYDEEYIRENTRSEEEKKEPTFSDSGYPYRYH